MKLVALFLFAFLCGSALAAVTAVARVDDFSIDSPALVIIVQGTLPTTISNFITGNSILGGERDLSLTAITGSSNLVLSAGVSTGTFNSAAPKGANGESIIQYDGTDNSIELDPSGLFSNGGNNFALNNAFALRSNITADIATNVFFRIYSGSSTNFCEFRQAIPGNSIPKLYTLNYSQFNKTGSGCDFSNVGAFEVEVDLAQNVDIAIDLIEIVADNPTPSRTPTRTPSQRPASPSRTRTPSPSRAVASASRTRTPTPTRAAPSESRTRTPTPSRAAASASRTRTPTPSRAPASASRTRSPSQIPRSPSNTPTPTSCICTCPELECIMFQYGENTFNGRVQRNIIDEFAVIDQNAQEEEGFDFLQLF